MIESFVTDSLLRHILYSTKETVHINGIKSGG